ncbi:hypothetical protein DEO72_LG9g3747 [Vigna unguiculata]|uniref:Uncharacterized protein n=1 Tax=Vigna unguiculata TaxID=3917 RepID=A0A4D6N601_VIGUN|nr:hypothetical protein DEO72_LG9g3747 [Vigna unguiculata]
MSSGLYATCCWVTSRDKINTACKQMDTLNGNGTRIKPDSKTTFGKALVQGAGLSSV